MIHGADEVNPRRFACQGIGYDCAFQVCVNTKSVNELSEIVVDYDDGFTLHAIENNVELTLGRIGIDDDVGSGVVVDEEGAFDKAAFVVHSHFQCAIPGGVDVKGALGGVG